EQRGGQRPDLQRFVGDRVGVAVWRARVVEGRAHVFVEHGDQQALLGAVADERHAVTAGEIADQAGGVALERLERGRARRPILRLLDALDAARGARRVAARALLELVRL